MAIEYWLITWWSAFALTHVFMTSRRKWFINQTSAGIYSLLFSAIAFACFIPLVSLYLDHRHQGTMLWALPSWAQHAGMALSVLGITGVIASLFQPSPTGMIPGGHQLSHGLTRITRHPMFMFLGLWGLGHCMINGFATDVAFFAGFPIFAVIGCAHQDHRKRNSPRHDLEQFYAETSLLPFMAILTGRNQLNLKELPWVGIVLGLASSIALYLLHPWMFG